MTFRKKTHKRSRAANELYVEEELWSHVRSCADYAAVKSPSRNLTWFGWIKQVLLIFEQQGYAVRLVDDHNNITFDATPAFLSLVGCEAGDFIALHPTPTKETITKKRPTIN
jgi:hypothetical protein